MMSLLAAIVLFFSVHWAYVAIMAARKVDLTLYWKVMLYPLGVAGLALDVAFNLTFGTLMYREVPRELLFTARCQRHAHGTGRRQRLALWWAKQLNLFDPDHIKL